MKILVTYPFGLGGVCLTELRQMGFSPIKKWYSLMMDAVQWQDVYRINLFSRIANKVFVVLAEQKIIDFDGLFDLIAWVDWKQYICSGYAVRVLAHSRESQLSSTRTIQSIVHKSILTQLTGSRDLQWKVDDDKIVIDVSVDIYKNMVTVMINTSGASLHERWYRTQQWEAPLKENIAAGLLLLSGWDRKSPLFDPFCGSGTICIEAAMMAAGIAPGLQRKFAFEEFGCFDGFVYDWLRQSAEKSKLQVARDVTSRNVMTKSISQSNKNNPDTSWLYSGWQLKIFWSDIDVDVLAKAKSNADRAGVGDMILFEEKHFLDVNFRLQAIEPYLQIDPGLSCFPTSQRQLDPNSENIQCVTNPPYGVRLGQESEELVEDLVSAFDRYSLSGWFLLLRGLKTPWFSTFDLLNGQQEVCFYKK